jgi:AMP-polyphosphate phosphotransferase
VLETVDLDLKLDRASYEQVFRPLRDRLSLLQREIFEKQVPVIVLFEGWDAAGKGDCIEKLVGRIDPRGYEVHFIQDPSEEEELRPFLWRFWRRLPARGDMAIFDRSWYQRVLSDRVDGRASRGVWQRSYEEINQFERMLAEDGTLIVKFWLHISRGEQRRRFRRMERSEYEAFRVTRKDWKAHRRYRRYCQAIEDMLERTSTPWAPWAVVPATDRRYVRVKVFETLADALQRALDVRPAAGARPKTRGKTAARIASPRRRALAPALGRTVLDEADLSRKLTDERYEIELARWQKRLREAEYACYQRGIPVVVVYEGWDAAGKGGSIRRVIGGMDPRGYAVIPISAPRGADAAHHYLWRFWNAIPRAGHIAIFDRSWYGRVLVERVEGYCTEEAWRRAYHEINEFERSLHHFGAVIVKFWLHVSKGTQLRRFEDRERTASKRYKITQEDWRNREKWELYRAAVHDMVTQTSTTYAPWTIVEADDKNWARVRSVRAVAEAMASRLE